MWGANLEEKTDYLTCEHAMKGIGQPVLNHNTMGRRELISHCDHLYHFITTPVTNVYMTELTTHLYLDRHKCDCTRHRQQWLPRQYLLPPNNLPQNLKNPSPTQNSNLDIIKYWHKIN